MASDASLVDNKKPSSSKKVAKVIHVAFKSFLGGKEDFFNHGINAIRPIFDDYKRLFVDDGGDYKQLELAYFAARVLNPLVASKMTPAEIESALKELKHFGFDEFRDANGIIDDLIKGIPAYLARINNTGDRFWKNVDGAADYDKVPAARRKDIEGPREVWRGHVEG